MEDYAVEPNLHSLSFPKVCGFYLAGITGPRVDNLCGVSDGNPHPAVPFRLSFLNQDLQQTGVLRFSNRFDRPRYIRRLGRQWIWLAPRTSHERGDEQGGKQ